MLHVARNRQRTTMPFKRVDLLPLTDECKHYDYVEDVPWDLQK